MRAGPRPQGCGHSHRERISLAYRSADRSLTAEAIRVVRQPDALRERRVALGTAVWVREPIAIIPDRHLEAEHVTAASVCDARLDEHLDARTAEPVARANQVIAGHPFGSPRA